jgi:Holliday junction resolvase RusA-like endonuclease
MNEIIIYGNVPSSKNSKRIAYIRGKILVLNSKFAETYIRETAKQWMLNKPNFNHLIKGKSKPYKIEFQFIRETKRRFDFVNLCQLPLDLMTKYEWIEDDDYTNVIPVINPEVVFDKKNCGIKIKVL